MFQTVSTASSTILLTLLPKTTIAIMPTTTEYNQDISSKIVDTSNYYDETTEAVIFMKSSINLFSFNYF